MKTLLEFPDAGNKRELVNTVTKLNRLFGRSRYPVKTAKGLFVPTLDIKIETVKNLFKEVEIIFDLLERAFKKV